MPVIRGQSNVTKLPEERRSALLARLVAEREGRGEEGGPVLFEIPLEQSDRIDVVVAWEEWEGVRSEDRTWIITEAYKDRAEVLALALGVTFDEAVAQGVLPFRLRLARGPEAVPEADLRRAELAVGGLATPAGEIQVRLPTRSMAEAAAQELMQRLPGSLWMVSYGDL
jgi:hypothetical protein